VGFAIDLNMETAASSDYFFMGVFDGLQSVLAPNGLDLLVLPCPTDQDRNAYLERFVARGVVDGIILAATQRVDRRIELLQSARIPFVTLGRSTSGKDYSWVDLDFEGVAKAAIDRFVATGHRIAVTVPVGEVNFGAVFLEAYRAALEAHALPFDSSLVFPTRRTEEAGYGLADAMFGLSDPPTAVLLIFEIAAIGLYRRLAELGRQPGRDLAIIGFRDEPTVRFLEPALTCFSVSLRGVGVSPGEQFSCAAPRYFVPVRATGLHRESTGTVRHKAGDPQSTPPRNDTPPGSALRLVRISSGSFASSAAASQGCSLVSSVTCSRNHRVKFTAHRLARRRGVARKFSA
jgi:DNA-binding LacI/PurR family transcriptional regulator